MRKQTTLADRFLKWLKIKWEIYRVAFLSSMGAGILSYMFVLTNKLVCADDAGCLFTKGATITSGRWALPLTSLVFPDFSMPWLNGLISIILVSVACCILIATFHINSKLMQGLMSAAIASTPVIMATLAYMFTAPPYLLAFFLSCFAVYLFDKDKPVYWAAALIPAVLAIGIYQSFITVISSLLLVLLIKRLIIDGVQTKEVWMKALFCALFLLVSTGIYYGVNQLVLNAQNAELNEYVNCRFIDDSFSIFRRMRSILYAIKEEMFRGDYCLMPTLLSRILHWVCFAAIALKMVLWMIKEKKASKIILAFLLLILLPLSINGIFLIISYAAVHTLMLYSFVSAYVLAAVLMDDTSNEEMHSVLQFATRDVVTVCLALICCVNIFFANKEYLRMYLEYENSFAFYSAVCAEVKTNAEYTEGTKLAIIGRPTLQMYDYSDFDDGTAHFDGIDVIPNDWSELRFIRQFLGFDPELASNSEISAIKETQEFREMSRYPYANSIHKIGNILVVKFGN